MTRQIDRAIATALSALALGLLRASMVTVAVFADGHGLSVRFLLTIALGYSCLGFLAGWLSASWRAAVWMSLPALPTLLVFRGQPLQARLMWWSRSGAGGRTRTSRRAARQTDGDR